MKYKYDNLVSINNNGYIVKVKENKTQYIISYKNNNKNFDKKAKRWSAIDKDSKQLFNTMKKICSKYSLNFDLIIFKLDKAFNRAMKNQQMIHLSKQKKHKVEYMKMMGGLSIYSKGWQVS